MLAQAGDHEPWLKRCLNMSFAGRILAVI